MEKRGRRPKKKKKNENSSSPEPADLPHKPKAGGQSFLSALLARLPFRRIHE